MRNIKKSILTIAASLALSAGTVFAGSFDGQYVGADGGTQFSLTIQQQDGNQIAGTLSVAGQNFPLMGMTDGQSIRGIIRGNTGEIPFTAREENGQLIVATRDGQMSCQRSGAPTQPRNGQTGAPSRGNFCGTPDYVRTGSVNTNMNDSYSRSTGASAYGTEMQPTSVNRPMSATGGQQSVQMQQGKFFQYAVPAGWQVNESQNTLDMSSPDKTACTQMLGLVGMYGEATPESFFQKVQELNQARGVQVLSARHIQPPQGYTDAAVFELSVRGTDGNEYRGQALVGVASGNGRHSGSCVIAISRADLWNSYSTWLPKVAMSVQATSADALGARGMIAAATPRPTRGGASLNQPMGDWRPYDASASNDRTARANSDAARGYEQMIDNTTGQRYYPGADAYDATRGGYVNPERPTEILDRVPDGE